MAFNSNLGQLFRGSGKSAELRAIRARWEDVQAAWRASPICSASATDPIGALALEINRLSWDQAKRMPAMAVAVALGEAIADLLSAEAIGDITPVWGAIDTDVSVAAEFRDALTRRFRYATDFARVHGVVRRQLLSLCDVFLEALPDSCFQSGEDFEGSLEVPLIELVDDPAELLRQFLALAYDREAQALDLFKDLRGVYRVNLLVASGLDPTLTSIDRPDRIIYPAAQRHKTAAQLADLYLAGTPFRQLLDVPVPFHVNEDVRFEHCHIVGGTGHGKTQFMQRMIHADLIRAQTERRSVVVIDSQGDMINRLSRLSLFAPDTPGSLFDRLVLIDPADIDYPPALNLFDAHLERLEDYRPVDRERVLNGVVEVYEHFFSDLLGAELTQKQGVVFKYLARLVLVIPGATIHTLMQLMENPRPYRPYMAELEGSARYFFETEFFEPSFAQTKKQILRRLWGVLSTPTFERMFAQPSNKLDLFQALQDGKIILVNTAKDLLKQEGSQLLGRFFIGLLAQATLERATLDPADRTATMVYVDEAQEYFDDTIETILNQARKYKTSITTAHQAVDQLSPRLRSILHANTSTKCAGGVSARDARALAEELHTEADFIESMRRRSGRSEFAVWIRNQTPRAIRVSVPLGFLESQPILTEEDYAALLSANRQRHCGTFEEVEAALRSLHRRPQETPAAELRPSGDVPEGDVEADRFEDAEEATRLRTPPRAPAPTTTPGKGGAQHKYLQQLVKQLAEERGFRAVIEEAVERGQVDVGLHQGDLSIACEISVTSRIDYEAQNIAKCIAAGFGRVWCILPDAKRRKAIRTLVEARLCGDQLVPVEFLTPEELVEALDGLLVPPPEENVVRGYRVTTTRKIVPTAEAKHRRAQIARILARSVKDADQ